MLHWIGMMILMFCFINEPIYGRITTQKQAIMYIHLISFIDLITQPNPDSIFVTRLLVCRYKDFYVPEAGFSSIPICLRASIEFSKSIAVWIYYQQAPQAKKDGKVIEFFKLLHPQTL